MNVPTGVNDTRFPPNRFPLSEAIAYIVAIIVASLAIIIGNAIVMIVFTKTTQLRQRKSYWLLINLAATDLLVGVVTGPLCVYLVAERKDILDESNSWLLTWSVASLYFSYSSLINLAMISLERMYATLWPWKHHVLAARKYHVVIGLSWFLPVFFSCADIGAYYQKFPHALQNILFFLTCFTLLTIVLSYVAIWKKFHANPQHHNVTTSQDRKLTKSMFIVTAASVTSWFSSTILVTVVCPFPVCDGWSRSSAHLIFYSALLLMLANSMLNPIIYAFRVPQLRRVALRLFCRRTNQIHVPAIEMRNRAEVLNRRACAVIADVPELNMAANE